MTDRRRRAVSGRAGIGLAAALVLTGLAGPAGLEAAERILTLDPERTEIRFTLGATLHNVEGTVGGVRGEIRFDPAGGPAGGEVIADATTADTGHKGRDRDMHEKVLESERFGAFVLRPTATTGALALSGTSRIELAGELEIHGGVHPVTLPAEVTVEGDRLAGTATLEVPYVEWGMKDPSKLLLKVKKLVEVEITLAGELAPADKISPADEQPSD